MGLQYLIVPQSRVTVLQRKRADPLEYKPRYHNYQEMLKKKNMKTQRVTLVGKDKRESRLSIREAEDSD